MFENLLSLLMERRKRWASYADLIISDSCVYLNFFAINYDDIVTVQTGLPGLYPLLCCMLHLLQPAVDLGSCSALPEAPPLLPNAPLTRQGTRKLELANETAQKPGHNIIWKIETPRTKEKGKENNDQRDLNVQKFCYAVILLPLVAWSAFSNHVHAAYCVLHIQKGSKKCCTTSNI